MALRRRPERSTERRVGRRKTPKSSTDASAKQEKNFEMENVEPERDEGMGRSLMAVAVAAVTLTVIAPFAFGMATVVGVAIGGALALSNLWAIALVVRGFLRGAGLPWGAFAAVKFVALVFLVWIVLKNGWAEVMPLALGYAALPLGIVVGQLGRGEPSRQKV
jgi:hypothetical protein